MDIKRTLSLETLLSKKSHFLLGPRGTGKSTLIRNTLAPHYQIIDLLESETRFRLLQNPGELESMIRRDQVKGVVIDEIQKVPELLDEVHRLIEKWKIPFLLTGSSARKLRRTGTNLLGGRARTAHLFPLTYSEISDFDLHSYLLRGGMPEVVSSSEPFEDLMTYVNSYLSEEVEQEAQVRKLGKFARFLKAAALSNAQEIHYANLASDAMVSESTVKEHYQILKDTLMGDILEPWRESKKRKAIQTPKFYFFDTGITHAITGQHSLSAHTDDFGKSFEHFIYMELRAALSYGRKLYPLQYWRSTHQQEVDFVLGDSVAIEVKSKDRSSLRDAKGLQVLREEKVFKRYFLVSLDRVRRREEGIDFIYWEDFLKELWGGEILV